jgi:hypothetical protein
MPTLDFISRKCSPLHVVHHPPSHSESQSPSPAPPQSPVGPDPWDSHGSSEDSQDDTETGTPVTRVTHTQIGRHIRPPSRMNLRTTKKQF